MLCVIDICGDAETIVINDEEKTESLITFKQEELMLEIIEIQNDKI